MAEGVVDALEPVEVKHEHAGGRVGLERLLEPLAENASVGQSRKCILFSQMLKLHIACVASRDVLDLCSELACLRSGPGGYRNLDRELASVTVETDDLDCFPNEAGHTALTDALQPAMMILAEPLWDNKRDVFAANLIEPVPEEALRDAFQNEMSPMSEVVMTATLLVSAKPLNARCCRRSRRLSNLRESSCAKLSSRLRSGAAISGRGCRSMRQSAPSATPASLMIGTPA